MEKLIILEINEEAKTYYEDNTSWYRYTAQKGDRVIESYCLLESGLSKYEAMSQTIDCIEYRGFENFIDLNNISALLRDLINHCINSTLDYYDSCSSDYKPLRKSQIQFLKREVKALKLEDYVRFYDDEVEPITLCYLSTVVDFATL